MLKKFLQIFFFIFCLVGNSLSQNTLYRTYPQPSPNIPMNAGGTVETPLRTHDGGYILCSKLWQWGFESPGGLADFYCIKTDSNFVPQWKKKYPSALVLPTGGILLFGQNTIEKVTASGVQLWIKTIGGNAMLCDGVSYGSNIRLVGNVMTYSYVPMTALVVYINDGFTLLIDSSGNYNSHQLFYSSVQNIFAPIFYAYRSSANFTRIKRDALGNFFVYSDYLSPTVGSGSMSIAKFNSNFGFIWGKTWNSSNNRALISDIDILPTGRIFATALSAGTSTNSYSYYPTLLKLDTQGNLVQQSFFQNKDKITPLCKKTNGNYIISTIRQDSVFMFETDTMMNILWHHYRGRAISASGTVIKSNTAFTSLYFGHNPVLISNDLSGNSCASYPIPFSKPTTSINLTNFTLSPVPSSVNIVTGTLNLIYGQSYVDSCKCPLNISSSQNHACVGNSFTVNVVGIGNISWYGSLAGNDFIHSGSQHVYYSNTPTIITVYAQDSACVGNANRSAVSVTFHAAPVLSITSNPTQICFGQTATITASGANTYTWNTGANTASISKSPANTTNYIVNGSTNGCSSSATIAIQVNTLPAVAMVPSQTQVCLGAAIFFTASGANTYTWNNGFTGPTYSIAPQLGLTSVSLSGSDGTCVASVISTIQSVAYPTISIVNSPAAFCYGKSVTITAMGAGSYSWSNGVNNNSFVITALSNTNIIVNGSNANCITSNTLNLNVHPNPTISITSNTTQVCAGDTVNMIASGALSYTWNTGALSSTLQHIPFSSQNYSVIGTNAHGCLDEEIISVTVVPLPTINFSSSNATLCAGETVTLNASGAISYTWSLNQSPPAAVISPTANTSYSVSGSNSFGCKATVYFTQNVDACTNLSTQSKSEFPFSLFPNPTSGNFILKMDTGNSSVLISIYSIDGKCLYSNFINQNETILNVEGFAAGVYFIKIWGTSQALKLIKE